jgi:zinc protease
MSKVIKILLMLIMPAVPLLAGIFPYAYDVKDFSNGLRVVVVPTDYPNIVSLQITVQTGSRNEVEPGKSGFAHFFEHMMFRGTEKYPSEKYNAIMKDAGADQNAYTTDDYTNFHITFSKEDLETVLKLEADRFRNLKYSEEDFKTESRAVLGEYNKNASNPIRKIFEVQRDNAFQTHTYKHTTMGFLKDVEDMPNQYAYSLQFYNRYYKPEYVSIIISGDVKSSRVFELISKYWGDWKKGDFKADIPAESTPRGPVYAHVSWDTPTMPWIAVAFHGPAASDQNSDMAVMDVIDRMAFSGSSDLYKKLVIDEQKVDDLSTYFPDRIDPYLVTVYARLKKAEDIWYVRDEILKTFAGLREEPVSAARLRDIQSNLRYGFAGRLDNSPAIASALVGEMARTRDPESLNRKYDMYEKITPKDIRTVADKYFTDQNLVVVSLSKDALPANEHPAGSINNLAAQPAAAPSGIKTVVIHNESPLINFRILFNTGAMMDPPGKEGLAKLTADMITSAGSAGKTYNQIQEALYPMAAGFTGQVDKEMTVFTGQVHTDFLTDYYDVISDMLLHPGWRESDFDRIKSNLINYIRVNLRDNNDEELGKEVLYEFIYGPGHPYGHLSAGHVRSLENISLDDVKEFYSRNYTQENLVLGIAGNYSPAFFQKICGDLGNLPSGEEVRPPLPAPPQIDGMEAEIVEKDTRATAISFGFPITVNRSSPDFAALWLIRSYFGEHRSQNSYLYNKIREQRGMNYGDYAYIEYFPDGMFRMYPEPNLGRQQQIFQVWIRPVRPEQAHFAVRAAMYELDKLINTGMSKKDFEATRKYLSKFVNLLTSEQGRQLGYALDSRYYGIGEFTSYIKSALDKLTLEQVNKVLREQLQSRNVKFVFVTKNAADLKSRLVSNQESPITYDAPKPEKILKEDETIQEYILPFEADRVRIVPLEDVFSE